ncbi:MULTISPECIES: T9SS type A sorting domain-containing protein [unclassified Lacinutrix]|uniref:T9SS type A sorting domain-containing protein n=1 Tax=Lacinutrix sp. WUR7 TaxID=2653681 RepID=UPI00193D3D2F|nr:T9SS type A sorting domain-containing protein [Lacinutrix sp. WUR7]QRM89497.1 T9SS type A sorting domain-containing protein [Lacinutrix sp. WUR7]
MRSFLKITIGLLLVTNVYSQTLPLDNTFFNPTIGAETQTISASGGTGDDSQTLQNAINTVNTAGGGKVIVNAGIYRILEVNLRSNVHLEVNSGVTFLPFNPSASANNALFNADLNTGINNFSLIGIGGNFTIDFTALAATIRIRAISFKYCSNFKVSNFNIIDNYTEFSSLAFGSNYTTTSTASGTRINNIRGIPNGGIIENISMTNGHYGFGLVQTQGGKNLLFRNLSTVGGATLRLETGFNLLQYTELYNFNDIKLDNIWARNIACTNGQSALQLSPHTLSQGYFNAENITATSCEMAVVWAAGFATNTQETDGLIPGSFDETSKIRNVTATFGQNAQMRDSRLRYIPCQLRVERSGSIGVASALNTDGESRTAPSPGAVLSEEDRSGYYPLDFPDTEVTAIGYNIAAHYLPLNAIFKSSIDDYEVCNESVNGVNFFIPNGYQNTPNPRNPLENGTLSVTNLALESIVIYPNPTTNILNIILLNNMEGGTVQFYSIHGKQVGNYQLQTQNKIDVSHLSNGVYILKFGKTGMVKKVVIN